MNVTTNVVPTDPLSLAHFYAVRSGLTPDEQTLVVAIAQDLSDEQRAARFNELLPLSVPEAVARVRDMLAQVEGYQPPAPSLTSPPRSPPAHHEQSEATSPPSPTQGTRGKSRAS